MIKVILQRVCVFVVISSGGLLVLKIPSTRQESPITSPVENVKGEVMRSESVLNTISVFLFSLYRYMYMYIFTKVDVIQGVRKKDIYFKNNTIKSLITLCNSKPKYAR